MFLIFYGSIFFILQLHFTTIEVYCKIKKVNNIVICILSFFSINLKHLIFCPSLLHVMSVFVHYALEPSVILNG